MTGLVSLWFFKSLQELPPGKAGLSTWHGICSEKAQPIWPLATALLLRTFRQTRVGDGGRKIHAKTELEFPGRGLEADMHTLTHELMLTGVHSHGTACCLGLQGLGVAGPRQSQGWQRHCSLYCE